MPGQRPCCALVSITRAAIRNWIRRYAHGPNLTLFCPKPSLFRHKTALTGSISSFVVPVWREPDLASWGARSDMAATREHVLQSHHRQISGWGNALFLPPAFLDGPAPGASASLSRFRIASVSETVEQPATTSRQSRLNFE